MDAEDGRGVSYYLSINMELPYWIALSLIDDIGPVTAKRLQGVFKVAAEIFRADEKSLTEIDGIGEKRAKAIKGFKSWDKVERIIKRCESLNIKILTQDDPSYPENLKTIQDPPVVLYIMGNPSPQDTYAIAIVGSRKATEYGKRVAEKLAKELVELGITIVSGLARGIDTTAHTSSLSAGGRTIGIFAGGLDRPYPPENKILIKKIIDNSYVISEFPPGTPPLRENFPKRNRIISGLSLGVIIVEAGEKSGALITVSYALDQGREVFAVPGSIFSRNSVGTNNLIRDGARLVTSVKDILEELAPKLRGLYREGIGLPISDPSKGGAVKEGALEFTDKEMDIINIISEELVHIDEIIRKTKLAPRDIASILLGLELKGVIRQIEGKRFYLTNYKEVLRDVR